MAKFGMQGQSVAGSGGGVDGRTRSFSKKAKLTVGKARKIDRHKAPVRKGNY